MTHARTTDKDAKILDQCARGRRIRNISPVFLSVAEDRTANPIADGIKDTTTYKAVFIAPCACEVTRCFANAIAFVDMDTSGSVTLKFSKAVIGTTDVDLCATIAVGAATVPTAETAIDGVLSTTAGALNLIEGQLVYATMVVSNHTVTTGSSGLVGCVEWIPKD